MINFNDVLKMLKSFNIIIYMKDRKHLLQLVEYEVRELYRVKLISQNDFLRSISILKKEANLL